MKALSLTQPWASLVAIGAKRIETRSWPTRYRGPVAIHASKAFPRADRQLCITSTPFYVALKDHYRRVTDIPVGAIIATARLVDVLSIDARLCMGLSSIKLDPDGVVRRYSPLQKTGPLGPFHGTTAEYPDPEAAFGDYTPGRFAWILADVVKLPEPIPARGALGLWEWERPPC